MSKFAVSFKGGLAKGFGAIGMIRFMQEKNIKPQMIAGSSSGALMATCYALGYDWQDILAFIQDFKFRSTIGVIDSLKTGTLLSPTKVREKLLDYTDDVNIEDLPIKLGIFVTDLKDKRRVTITKGNLINALVASLAYPFVFPSIEFEGRKYVDGDLSVSYSANTLRHLSGAENVIGVASFHDGMGLPFGDALASKFVSTIRILSVQLDRLHSEVDPVEIDLRYETSDVNFTELDKAPLLAERVYKKCLEKEQEILALV